MNKEGFDIRTAFTIYHKEISYYAGTPAAYIVIIVFLLINGYFFSQPLFLVNQATLEGFYDGAPFLLTFFIPALTMRSFSEEFKTGTMETLSSFPAGEFEILAAKLAAALTLIAVVFLLTLVYPATLAVLGRPDRGGIAGAYAGLFLTALLFSSAGIFASTLTRNQVVAFIMGFIISFALFIIGKTSVFAPAWLRPAAEFAGIDSHLSNFTRGVIDLRDLVYYFTLSALFVYFAQIKLRLRKHD